MLGTAGAGFPISCSKAIAYGTFPHPLYVMLLIIYGVGSLPELLCPLHNGTGDDLLEGLLMHLLFNINAIM